MEIEFVSKRENKLLDRIEVDFKIGHEGGTPSRKEVREEVASKMGVETDRVIIDRMRSIYGISETTGYAKIYSSPDKVREIEADYMLERNQLKIEKKKESKEETKEEKEGKEEKKEGKKETQKEEEKKEGKGTEEAKNQKSGEK